MTYLFLIIGVSIINSLADTKSSVSDVLFTNFVIIAITFCLEKIWLQKQELSSTVLYEKIDLIKPERRLEMIIDLQERTGITKINRIEIGKIDFLRDTCTVRIFYNVSVKEVMNADQDENNKDDDDD